jgi:hypothetical protein
MYHNKKNLVGFLRLVTLWREVLTKVFFTMLISNAQILTECGKALKTPIASAFG